METINMAAINVMVKDVANFLDNLGGLDYRLIAEFFSEDGYYIGEIDHDYMNGFLTVPNELRVVWRNKVKFSRMYTLQNEVIITLVVLKGEEK